MPTLTRFVILSVVLSQAGCVSLAAFLGQKKSPELDTSLLQAQGYSIPPGGMPTQIDPQVAGSGPHVVLEIRSEDRHLESVPLPMDRPVFVEDIVRDAQLSERFGRLRISIMRPNGSEAPPVRLDLRTNSDGKATSVGGNYALLPGDHIIINEDNRSGLERFIDSQFKND